MLDLRDIFRRVPAALLAVALAATLWPPLGPVVAWASFAEEGGASQEEPRDPAEPAEPGEPEGPDGDAGESGEDGADEDANDQLLKDKAADQEMLCRIAGSYGSLTYAYRTQTRWDEEGSGFEGEPHLQLAYRFAVDADATSSQLAVWLEDDADALTLIVEPRDMPQEAAHVKVDAFLEAEEEPSASLEFDVNEVAKKPISGLSLDALPFRTDAEEQARQAEAAMREALLAPGSGLDAEDVRAVTERPFADFQLRDYPAAFSRKEEQGFSVACAFNLDPFLEERYWIADELKRFVVAPIEEVRAPAGLLLNGTDGSAWLTQDVIATYAGHSLSYVLDAASFWQELPLNSAEGIYEDVVLYAQDDRRRIVTKLVGVAYRVDKTAPVLTSFSVEGQRREEADAWFFTGSASVAVSVKDSDPATEDASAFGDKTAPLRLERSGLSEASACLTCESVSGEQWVQEGISIAGPSEELGSMQCRIEGDQDVRADSFRVRVQDQAGNVLDSSLEGVREMPAEVQRLVSDAAAPELIVAFDNNDARNGSHFNAGRTVTFTVREANFPYLQEYDPDQIIASVSEDGRTHVIRAKDLQSIGADAWQASYGFFRDADCTVEAQVTDLVGKASERHASSFTIDQTPPDLSVAFDGGESAPAPYCDAARTAIISVTDRSFAPGLVSVDAASSAGTAVDFAPAVVGDWEDEGDVHRCTAVFPGEGTYRLAVTGCDLAANPMAGYACPEFTVDTQRPRISVIVGGDEDASSRAYRGGCAASVVITDANVDPATSVILSPIGLDALANPYLPVSSLSETEVMVAFTDPAAIPENDGVYQLEVRASDRAGNAETKTVTWSVNRFGSTYVLDEATRALLSQRSVRSEALCDLRIQEINPSGVDAHGASVSLAQGTRNRTLAEGEGYLIEEDDLRGWPACSYIVSKENFDADGLYHVTVHSTDAAGNASLNTMARKNEDRTGSAEVSFAVDDTPPLITFSGFDGQRIFTAPFEAAFTVEDNGALSHAILTVDGQEVRRLDANELADGAPVPVPLGEGPADRVVSVEAHDMAGNQTVRTAPSVFVHSDPVARWMRHPATVAALVLMVGMAAVAAVCFLRRHSAVR